MTWFSYRPKQSRPAVPKPAPSRSGDRPPEPDGPSRVERGDRYAAGNLTPALRSRDRAYRQHCEARERALRQALAAKGVRI